MFEAAIFLIIAGGLWVMANRMQNNRHAMLPPTEGLDRRALSVLAEGGLYSLTTPSEAPQLRGFRHLQLVEGGLALSDNVSGQVQLVDFATIQWVSAVRLPQEGIAEITLHLEVNRQWRILSLQMPSADMTVLVKLLRQVVSASRSNIGRPPAQPIGPLTAHVTEDTLQGDSQLGAEVNLYLLPHMLIVLQGDTVQAKLDTSSIRRVLSVERVSGRLDGLLNPQAVDGVIRLYSLHETVSFALPQFRELAEEISYLSRCPAEFITQEDKTGKI